LVARWLLYGWWNRLAFLDESQKEVLKLAKAWRLRGQFGRGKEWEKPGKSQCQIRKVNVGRSYPETSWRPFPQLNFINGVPHLTALLAWMAFKFSIRFCYEAI
jgi:hypothetical protein